MFNNQYSCSLKKDLSKFKSIRVEKAVLPLTYYNVKGDLHNNYIRYVTIDDQHKVDKRGSLVVSDGLYTVEDFNQAIQSRLKEINQENAFEILYHKNQGCIEIKINNERFLPYIHKTMCLFLGLNCGEMYLRNSLTGTKAPQFL